MKLSIGSYRPIRPVTLNSGRRMPSWFDLKGLSSSAEEDIEGIQKAAATVISSCVIVSSQSISVYQDPAGNYAKRRIRALAKITSPSQPELKRLDGTAYGPETFAISFCSACTVRQSPGSDEVWLLEGNCEES